MLVVFEGVDGSGKTELMRRVADILRQGHSVVTTREPGGTPLGEELRNILCHGNHEMSHLAQTLLFMADREHHVRTVVRPALEHGNIVLCDRYLASTLVYQYYLRDIADSAVSLGDLLAMHELVTNYLYPNITVYIDISAKDAAYFKSMRDGESSHFDEIEAEKLLDAYDSVLTEVPQIHGPLLPIRNGRGADLDVLAGRIAQAIMIKNGSAT